MERKSRIIFFSLTLLAIIISIFIAASIGVIKIPMEVLFDIIKSKIGIGEYSGSSYLELTVTALRLPRIFMALLVGSALAISGSLFQSIFRNPICDPYILGISSGASLGAAIAFILGWDTLLFGITIPALITALITLFFILGIARLSACRTTQTLLLIGIALNFLISALITLIIVVHEEEMHKIIFWTMGSFGTVTWTEVALFAPLFCIALIPLFYYAKDLNIMQFGNDTARSLGVNTSRVTVISLISASLLIASAVSFCGAIGFVGLIIPQMVRLLMGNQTRTLFIFSALFGAFFMLVADTLARTIAAPSELPVGSITAIAGVPYFIYLLMKKNR